MPLGPPHNNLNQSRRGLTGTWMRGSFGQGACAAATAYDNAASHWFDNKTALIDERNGLLESEPHTALPGTKRYCSNADSNIVE